MHNILTAIKASVDPEGATIGHNEPQCQQNYLKGSKFSNYDTLRKGKVFETQQILTLEALT
jgi:hypothetical protein